MVHLADLFRYFVKTADVGMEKLKISDNGSVQGYRAVTQALDSASY